MSQLSYQECRTKNECVNMNKPRKIKDNCTSSFHYSLQLTKLIVNKNAMMEILSCTVQKIQKKAKLLLAF